MRWELVKIQLAFGIALGLFQTTVCADTTVLLPHNFRVFVGNHGVINHPVRGSERRILPTINHYAGKDGGYVALYSRNPNGAVYSIGNGIYVVGQIRVKGSYLGRIFYPEGYAKGDDITRDPKILKLCDQYFPEFKGEVWIGGDTGGWFGVQR
jgi:hypothetical protein